MASSTSKPASELQVIRGREAAAEQLKELLKTAKEKLECCFEPGALLFADDSVLFEAISQIDQKKLETGLVTEITENNLLRSSELMRRVNVYHLAGIKGNFMIIDGKRFYSITPSREDGTDSSFHILAIDDRQFTETQQFLFKNLLHQAVSAKARISEIEKGVKSEFIETIRQPAEAMKIVFDLIRRASFEILVLLPTVKTFYRADMDGIIRELGEASNKGVKVRVLVKADSDSMKELSKQRIKEKHEDINVQFSHQAMRSRITTFIVDEIYSLALEVNDDTANTFLAATGISTYSNSESTVLSYTSMFESLWIQADIERQGKIKQAYFQIFKGQKLRDEVYERRWTADSKDEA